MKQPSLAFAQTDLETATKELKSSQTAYLRAVERLNRAQDNHDKATEALNATILAVKMSTRVKNIFAQ